MSQELLYSSKIRSLIRKYSWEVSGLTALFLIVVAGTSSIDWLLIISAITAAIVFSAIWFVREKDINEAFVALIIGLIAVAGERYHHVEDINKMKLGLATDVASITIALIDLEAPKIGGKPIDGFLERLRTALDPMPTAMPVPSPQVQQSALPLMTTPVPAKPSSSDASSIPPPPPPPQTEQPVFGSAENYFALYDAVASRIGDLDPRSVESVSRFYTDLKLVRDLTRNLNLVRALPITSRSVEYSVRFAEIASSYDRTICDGIGAYKYLTGEKTVSDDRFKLAIGKYPTVQDNLVKIGEDRTPCEFAPPPKAMTAKR